MNKDELRRYIEDLVGSVSADLKMYKFDIEVSAVVIILGKGVTTQIIVMHSISGKVAIGNIMYFLGRDEDKLTYEDILKKEIVKLEKSLWDEEG